MKKATINFSGTEKVDVWLTGVTNCMQMRIKMANGIELFECGFDIIKTKKDYVVYSEVGICGCNLLNFVRNFLRYRDVNISQIEYIRLTDDKIYTDRENEEISDIGLEYGFEETYECPSVTRTPHTIEELNDIVKTFFNQTK